MKNIFAGSHTEHRWRCVPIGDYTNVLMVWFGLVVCMCVCVCFFWQLHFTTIFKCEINLTSPKIIHTIEYLCLGWVHYGSSYGAVHLPSTNIHSVILQKNIVHYNLICLFLKFVCVKSFVHELVLKSCGLKCSTKEILVNSSCFWALA